MRLIHIFWSLVVVVGLITLPTLLFLHRGKLQGGPEIVGTFLIFWWILDIVTPLALCLAWLKKRPLRNSFTFTLLAFLNLYFGLMGIYHLMPPGSIHAYEFSFFVFLLNLSWAAVIILFQIRS